MKIQANTVDGTYKVDAFDSGIAIYSYKFFHKMLSTLKDGQVVGAELNAAEYAELNEQYGVR